MKGPRRAKRSFEVMGDFYHGDDVYRPDQNNANYHKHDMVKAYLIFVTDPTGIPV